MKIYYVLHMVVRSLNYMRASLRRHFMTELEFDHIDDHIVSAHGLAFGADQLVIALTQRVWVCHPHRPVTCSECGMPH